MINLKTAIVTGAAGFIGSHLAEKLLEKKFRVIGIDCFTDYYSQDIKRNNLNECLKNENFILLEEDLMHMDLIPIFNKSQILFHEAAQPGVRESWGKEFDTYVKDNILVTQRILECAKKTKSFEKIILASSSSIYGDQEGKMSEEKTIPKPISPYGATKLASENLGYLYAKNYNLPVISLRYFTVYGPRQRPDMAFTKFIKAILKQEKINVYGDGNQTRDFTYIDDVVDANISCINVDITGEVINVGGGHIISINDVIKTIQKISEFEFKVTYIEKQRGDVEHTEAETSKVKKLLNFYPKVPIDTGLRKQIDYLKNNLSLYV